LSTIQSLGSAASRRFQKHPSNHVTKSVPKSALMTECETVGDDWLIDDLRPSSKKHKGPTSNFVTTSGTKRKRSGDGDGSHSQQSKRSSDSRFSTNDDDAADIVEISDQPTISSSDDNVNNILNSELNFGEDSSSNDSIIEMLPDLDDFRPSSKSQREGHDTSKKPKRQRQLKLTSFQKASFAAGLNRENNSHTRVAFQDQSRGGLDALPAMSHDPVIPAPSLLMRVKVRIKDKLILVPIMQRSVCLKL
jgi:hypothetical protein